MTKSQFRILIVLTVVSGFLGGAASNLLLHGGPVAAQTVGTGQEVVKAEGSAPPALPSPDFSQMKAAPVVRVVNANTVVLLLDGAETTITLIGVDPPMTGSPDQVPTPFAREAETFIQNLLKGESVYLEHEGDEPLVDASNRTLAYLYRAPDGLFVNLESIRQGYARAYGGYAFRQRDLFGFYQKAAQTAQKGLWAVAPTAQVTPADVSLSAADSTLGAELRKLAEAYGLRYTLTEGAGDIRLTAYFEGNLNDAVRALAGAAGIDARFADGEWAISESADHKAARLAAAVRPTTPVYTAPARAPTYTPAPTYRPAGNCPQGGVHTPGKTDRNGRLHCKKCGRFM